MRVKLIVEYDGTRYAGWQRQKNAVAVQQRLEEAIWAVTGEHQAVTGASRTDAGVHALGRRRLRCSPDHPGQVPRGGRAPVGPHPHHLHQQRAHPCG